MNLIPELASTSLPDSFFVTSNSYWMSGYAHYENKFVPMVRFSQVGNPNSFGVDQSSKSARYPTDRAVFLKDKETVLCVNWRKAKRMARKGLLHSVMQYDGTQITERICE